MEFASQSCRRNAMERGSEEDARKDQVVSQPTMPGTRAPIRALGGSPPPRSFPAVQCTRTGLGASAATAMHDASRCGTPPASAGQLLDAGRQFPRERPGRVLPGVGDHGRPARQRNLVHTHPAGHAYLGAPSSGERRSITVAGGHTGTLSGISSPGYGASLRYSTPGRVTPPAASGSPPRSRRFTSCPRPLPGGPGIGAAHAPGRVMTSRYRRHCVSSGRRGHISPAVHAVDPEVGPRRSKTSTRTAHVVVRPPSTTMSTPVMKLASSEAR